MHRKDVISSLQRTGKLSELYEISESPNKIEFLKERNIEDVLSSPPIFNRYVWTVIHPTLFKLYDVQFTRENYSKTLPVVVYPIPNLKTQDSKKQELYECYHGGNGLLHIHPVILLLKDAGYPRKAAKMMDSELKHGCIHNFDYTVDEKRMHARKTNTNMVVGPILKNFKNGYKGSWFRSLSKRLEKVIKASYPYYLDYTYMESLASSGVFGLNEILAKELADHDYGNFALEENALYMGMHDSLDLVKTKVPTNIRRPMNFDEFRNHMLGLDPYLRGAGDCLKVAKIWIEEIQGMAHKTSVQPIKDVVSQKIHKEFFGRNHL